MGWRHFLAANSWSWTWSWPRAGGAAKSGPITLKRKCAQRSWNREVDDVSFIGCDYFIFSTTSVVRSRFYTSVLGAVAWLQRAAQVPRPACKRQLRRASEAV